MIPYYCLFFSLFWIPHMKYNRSSACFLHIIPDETVCLTPFHFYCFMHDVDCDQSRVHDGSMKHFPSLLSQDSKWELENNILVKMCQVWIEKSLLSSPEKDFLLSVIMRTNDSPRKWCILLIAHTLSRLVWSSGAELAALQITEMVAKTKLLWKGNLRYERNERLTFDQK